MDGFDLGIGILFPGFRSASERDQAMNSIAPVWDGNETWLVLGGGGLMAAFPLAYAIILPALYAPLIAMLLGLVFRGVAFEYRWRDPGHRKYWDCGFFRRLAGRDLRAGHHAGRPAPGHRGRGPRLCRRLVGLAHAVYSLLTGAGLVVGYALLGATWLIWKTEGELQARARRLARLLAAAAARGDRRGQPRHAVPAAAIFGALVRTARPAGRGADAAAVRRAVALASGGASRGRRDWLPFLLALGLFLLVDGRARHLDLARRDPRPGHDLAGRGAAFEPDLHAGRRGVLMPLILAYTAWAYWVFRGKVGEHGYH